MDFKNLTRKEKNDLAHQYEPLVIKITNQFHTKKCGTWNQLSGAAWEGFARAINTYDEKRSKMTFMQFAGFSIRNNILNYLNNESRVVKINAYNQEKIKKNGGGAKELFNSVSMDQLYGNRQDGEMSKEFKYNLYSKPNCDGDVFEFLYSKIDAEFNEMEREIFYKTFGLKDYEVTKGMDLAKDFNISHCKVSRIIKKVTTWIRKDEECCEMIQNLL